MSDISDRHTLPVRRIARLRALAALVWHEVAPFRADFWIAMTVTVAAAATGLLLPGRAQVLVEQVLPNRAIGLVAWHLGILLAIAALSIGLSTLRRFVLERLALRLITRARRALFAHVLAIRPQRLNEAEGGQIMTGFASDLMLYLNAVKTVLAVVVPSALFMVVYTAAMIWYSWQLSLLLVFVVLPLVVATNFFARRIHAVTHAAQRALGRLIGELGETLGGTREIKLFTMEERVLDNFEGLNQSALKAMVDRERLSALHPFAVSMCVAVGIAIIILASVAITNAGWISGGDLAGFLVCLALAYPPIQEFSHSLGQIVQLDAVHERLVALFAIPVEDGPPEEGEARPADAGISLSGVSFGYGAGTPVLQDITLEVKPGERVAIVGPSGAGKSTLLELLPRFHVPDAGTIRIGGADVTEMSLKTLRSQIGLVLQVPFLFRATLLDNLRAGAPGASREQVLQVAREARVDEFAARLPQGYDTKIEPGGTNLSVGQRQRIAIARVLLKNPPILLLDEPTSALDAASERLVGDAIRQVAANRTTLIVAHRLTTVADVDRVVVMDGGRIVEAGTHDVLLAQDGLYAALWRQADLGH